jgi:hypothetical protein
MKARIHLRGCEQSWFDVELTGAACNPASFVSVVNKHGGLFVENGTRWIQKTAITEIVFSES